MIPDIEGWKLGLKAGFFVSIRIRLRYDPHIDVHLGQ
jgi:hypothetical protein